MSAKQRWSAVIAYRVVAVVVWLLARAAADTNAGPTAGRSGRPRGAAGIEGPWWYSPGAHAGRPTGSTTSGALAKRARIEPAATLVATAGCCGHVG
jgi:hypothetical protein